jgi:hypothetical protein
MDITNQVNTIVQSILNKIQEEVQVEVVELIQKQVADQVAKIDVVALFNASFANSIKNGTFTFPEGSIPLSSVNHTGLALSGNDVKGGIIENFGSTGIDDKATSCQLTILDSTTVVENNLLTKDLTVKGTVNIEGNMNITGTLDESSPLYQKLINNTTTAVRTSFSEQVFAGYANMVFDQIKLKGVDIPRLSVNGQSIVEGGVLNAAIIGSSLKSVGSLNQLEVTGESYMAGTLYTSNKRVGINTTQPEQAFSLWDQEIEIGFGKKTDNVGIFGTPRAQTLVISSNNKQNLTINPDGSVTAAKMQIGNVTISSSATPPSDNQPKGAIVFNENPSLGGPLGWVSLGNSNWANFGIVD